MVLLKRGVTQKSCYSAAFYINLCTIHFYNYFAKYRNLVKNIASGKIVVDSPDLKALANSLRPRLAKGEKDCVIMM